jgi:cytidylate kinase|tara:strand:- start:75 stop:737 length:663 start_codon:yes stop_codon:yes gene_type:complete
MKYYQELQEGLYDPNIFKAFFLAGGPGSGKSYVVRRTTGGSGLKTVNSDIAFEHLLKKAGLSLKMPPEEFERKEKIRIRAKKLTAKQRDNYLDGRLGLIIDGTGKNPDNILKQKAGLEELGYDTYMIFVKTSLDVALERNENRPRTLEKSLVISSWKAVDSNMGIFSNAFRQGFIVVDNNDADDDIYQLVWKRIQGLLRNKVTNTRAKNWIAMELTKKQR